MLFVQLSITAGSLCVREERCGRTVRESWVWEQGSGTPVGCQAESRPEPAQNGWLQSVVCGAGAGAYGP